ncbi:MAG: 50S ribosomal protein L11 methyltransferase [Aurantibacter sp.]
MPDTNDYIEYKFRITPLLPTAIGTASEILIAELGQREFESFVEQKDGLLAYIRQMDWNENILKGLPILKNPDFKIDFKIKEIEQQNWNAAWEQSFEPIRVGGRCMVRAPFHEKSDVQYDIVIEPKMSFGTGHHETTQMMLQYILGNDFEQKAILDMGSGTGVLAILAEKRGASKVDAVDIDHRCFLNAGENVKRNNCLKIKVFQGDSSFLGNQNYDIILANINRNTLLNDIPDYERCLNKEGTLFLSGFYFEDIPMIREKCAGEGLVFQNNLQEGDWVAIKFLKK